MYLKQEYYTINDIKSMTQLKAGIQSDQYTLVYGGKLLQEYRTLASLDIWTESTLYMIFNPRDVMPIFVKTPSGKIVKVEVKGLYTVHDVKAIVESFIGCSVAECRMIYSGNELQDCKTLAFYNIEENSTLEVLPSWIQIFIKTWNGKTITLDVARANTVREVKDKIFCKVRVPVHFQSILFSENTLKINVVLQDTTLRETPLSTWFGLVNQIQLSFMIPEEMQARVELL